MCTLRTYEEDLKIARAILNRDEIVTRSFFYKECFPLFHSLYHRYTTDCDSIIEFINEIYLLIMTPSKKTGRCQLENYRGESSLMTWLKVTALYFCYGKFEIQERMPKMELLNNSEKEENEDVFDRIMTSEQSLSLEMDNINKSDVETLLNLMPNHRYRELIRLRYIKQYSNEDTAEKLGMSMDNYYNSHKRAKEQFLVIYRKEENHG